MGQKVHPTGLRLGIIRTWDSRWYADKEYADFVEEDFKVRKFLKKKLFHAGISKIEIERFSKQIRLRVFAARPGIIIGKKGSEIALLKKELEGMLKPSVLIDDRFRIGGCQRFKHLCGRGVIRRKSLVG